jgi:FixJ family two-component response regulator
LVLDVRIPGMTGVDLLRHLAANGSRVPEIMLIAHGDDETRWRCLEDGAAPALLDALGRALAK